MRQMTTVIITGCVGFIGFHVSIELIKRGYFVIGVDEMNDYYSPKLKEMRLKYLLAYKKQFNFSRISIDSPELEIVFKKYPSSIVINLAGYAGVRHSFFDPHSYIRSNVSGFMNILELSRKYLVPHLIYASSSSVYGSTIKDTYSIEDNTDTPLSVYAASKKTNELFAYVYGETHGMQTTGLRFFTVYGPWGRPDMSYYLFAKSIQEGRPINVFNHGNMKRDFTYIDDVVSAITKLIPAKRDKPFKIYNVGSGSSVDLMEFIQTLEKHLGQEAKKKFLPLQPGEMIETHADIHDLVRDIGYYPKVQIDEGLQIFAEWFKAYPN